MSTIQKAVSRDPSTSETLSKVVIRAADKLRINQSEFAEFVGMSQAQVSRLWAGKYLLSQSKSSEWERAILFFRMYRSLTTLVEETGKCEVWIRTKNLGLGGKPTELMKSLEGLIDVVRYLDASRGNV